MFRLFVTHLATEGTRRATARMLLGWINGFTHNDIERSSGRLKSRPHWLLPTRWTAHEKRTKT
jgi:hypothetical protein